MSRSVRSLAAALSLWLLATVASPAFGVDPDELLADPALEARARTISQGLRCLVCQNQSIDDSGADLARDLRHLVRERLLAGDSDDQVRAFLVDRYGDFVLLDPPIKPKTWGLWFGPPAILLIAVGGMLVYFRRRRHTTPVAPLSADELARLAAMLEREEG